MISHDSFGTAYWDVDRYVRRANHSEVPGLTSEVSKGRSRDEQNLTLLRAQCWENKGAKAAGQTDRARRCCLGSKLDGGRIGSISQGLARIDILLASLPSMHVNATDNARM